MFCVGDHVLHSAGTMSLARKKKKNVKKKYKKKIKDLHSPILVSLLLKWQKCELSMHVYCVQLSKLVGKQGCLPQKNNFKIKKLH